MTIREDTVSGASVPKRKGLKKPTDAYARASTSLDYRLSELMFGSLLASFVLGFLSFPAAKTNGQITPNWSAGVQIAPSLFISIAYAYLTAGLYVSYHAGILTMHHMPLRYISLDFLLALGQGIAFGVSMLFPVLFPGAVGLTILLSVL